MRKDYQNQEIDTSQPAVPDTVSVALAELAGEMRACWHLRSGPGTVWVPETPYTSCDVLILVE